MVVGRETADAEAATIEKTQRALRDSIEQSKLLAEEADKLVQQNRQGSAMDRRPSRGISPGAQTPCRRESITVKRR
jgi:hypothetical protein